MCSAGFCTGKGQTCEPTFSRVVTGTFTACAVDQFDRWWCWGSNADNQISPSGKAVFGKATLVSGHRWQTLSLGGGHACGLDEGELWCWGRNDRNQVSAGFALTVDQPVRIELSDRPVVWSAVSAGPDNTCAIANGILYCWGAGTAGKLGGGDVNDAPMPQKVAGEITDWIAVDTGGRHSCGISQSLGLHCWGDGSLGQLGNGGFVVHSEPQPVALTDVVGVAVGLESSCAVTAAGELLCWGRSGAGALGDPTVVDPRGPDTAVPVRATGLDGWQEVASAERYACARRNGSEVWCWGESNNGGLGNGFYSNTARFGHVIDGASSIDVAWNGTDADPGRDTGDSDLSCAVVEGIPFCWGDDAQGQLGLGAAASSEAPVSIVSGERWARVVAGRDHVCALTTAGAVHCWGSNEHGQRNGLARGIDRPCNSGEACNSGVPLRVETQDAATAIVVGGTHSCALGSELAMCWGDNRVAQCARAPAESSPPNAVTGEWSALYGGGAASCAIGGGGTTCWGDYLLGAGLPRLTPALDDVVQLAIGNDFGCALRTDHELACWGDPIGFGNGAAGSCNDGVCNAGETAASCASDCGPGPLSHLARTYQSIAIGSATPFACGLRSDARIECWGDNRAGQAGQTFNDGSGPVVVDPVVTPFEIAGIGQCSGLTAGGRHACAICGAGLVCWGDGSHGELGPPATRDPVTIPRIISPTVATDPWVEVTAGNGFTCGRTAGGHIQCWGTSRHGALGNGAVGTCIPTAVRR